MTVFIKVPVSKELPTESKKVFTSEGFVSFYTLQRCFLGNDKHKVSPDWWLKEVDIPDEQMDDKWINKNYGFYNKNVTAGIRIGIDHIINKLK